MENNPMDNENKNQVPDDDSWFDDLLKAPEVGSESGADEQAMSSHPMTQLSDVELEKILEEIRMESSDNVDDSPEPAQEPFRDADFLDTFGTGAELQQAFSDEPASEPSEETGSAFAEDQPEYREELSEDPSDLDIPVRKVRPKRKKGYGLFGLPHLISTVIWLVIIVAIGTSLGHMIWVCAAEVLAFGREDHKITITITESDDLDSITDKLERAGLIRYPDLFKLYAALTDAEEEIIPGTFELNTLYDYMALVNNMSYVAVAREEIDIMIPEGYTCAQIFALLEENGVCTAAELEEYSADGELEDYWFLEGIQRGDKYCLEGFLFPDTYRFYVGSAPRQALEKMLNGFNSRVGEQMLTHIEEMNTRFAAMLSANGYGQDYIDAHKLTIREIVIIASMIEKESSGLGEGYTISSVIYNRLANPGAFPFLNIDATIVYALGGKTDLTEEDLKVDSPYNTYIHEGLTPGPIANPGLASLNAALDPDETSYYFYALDPSTNTHHFSSTLEEHQQFLDSIKE